MKKLLFTVNNPAHRQDLIDNYNLMNVEHPKWPASNPRGLNGISIMGQLKETAGNDDPIFLEGDFPEENGVYDCTYIPGNLACKLYLQYVKAEMFPVPCGYLVLAEVEIDNQVSEKAIETSKCIGL